MFRAINNREIKESVFLNRIKIFSIIFFAFSSWPFFYYGFFISKVALVLSALGLAAIFLSNIKRVNSIYLLCFSCFVFLCWISTVFSVYPSISAKGTQRFVLYSLLILSVASLSTLQFCVFSKAINFILIFFALLAIPSLLLSCIYLAGYNNFLPSMNLNLGGRGDLYLLSPLGIVTKYTIIHAQNGLNVVRINALCEEPGLIGTYAIYFIILNQMYGTGRRKLWVNISLNVLGTLSYSLFYFVAGWVLLPVAAIFAFIHRKWSMVHLKGSDSAGTILVGALVSVCLLLSIMTFSKIYSGSAYAVYSYSPFYRLFSGDKQAFNNRSVYDRKILQETQKTGKNEFEKLMFGHGPDANSINPDAHFSSWTSILYDNGFLGLISILVWYTYIFLKTLFSKQKINLYSSILIFPFLLSFYQRPEFISPLIIICWVGIERYFSDDSLNYEG